MSSKILTALIASGKANMNATEHLQNWLVPHSDSLASVTNYSHRILKENDHNRSKEVLEELQAIVQKAHGDAKRNLRRLAGLSLDPLGSDPNDPTIGYPEMLDIITLQGYFGEIFAGIVAENFDHFEESGWEVPAYPFRFHNVAFAALENWRQTGELPNILPGRTGDDLLAFLRDENGRVIRSLVCEAKCTRGHQSNLISEAHRKASSTNRIPVDVLQLIEILQDYDDVNSKDWVNALRDLYQRKIDTTYERIDMVAYICGRSPQRRTSWISPDRPHDQYTARRKLEAIEVHLNGVLELIRIVYNVPNNAT